MSLALQMAGVVEDAVQRAANDRYNVGKAADANQYFSHADALVRPEDYFLMEIFSFPQTWNSTALGFGGIGGAMITSAMTDRKSTRLNSSHSQISYAVF